MSSWSSVLKWVPRTGLGDKCFLPLEAFERLQQYLTSEYADQPVLKNLSITKTDRMDTMSSDAEDDDQDSDEDSGAIGLKGSSSSNSNNREGKGKLRESSETRNRSRLTSLQELQDQNLERKKGQPLTLLFTNQRTGAKVYGGVLEFSAAPGEVSLTPYLAKSLQLDPDDAVTVRLVTLPKGTFAKLQPLQPDYLEIPDFRAALESLLRGNFTTLTQGEIISLSHQGKEHDILVSELKPSPAVSITDTDLEVDVVPLDALSLSGKKETRSLQLGGPSLLGQVKKDESDHYAFECPRSCNFRIFVKCLSGDADLFVSKTSPKPSLVDHTWVSVEKGDCELQIFHDEASSSSSSFGFLPQNTYYVAVRGYDPESQYSIAVNLVEKKAEDAPLSDPSVQPSPDHKQCTNCNQWIPSRTYDMHTAFCFRNNFLCKVCHRVVQKNQQELHYHCPFCEQLLRPEEREKHERMKHGLHPCTCGMELDLALLLEHRRRYCPDRMINCKYCHDYVKAGPPSEKFGFDISQHEEYCGSRTIDCVICKKPVALKDLVVHEKIHEYEKQTKPVPFELCHNVCCTNPEDPGNILGLCQRCYGPFWSSSNDPGNKRLLQRLIGKYHQQIMVGCKSATCRNQYCLSNPGSEINRNQPDSTGSAFLALTLVRKSALQVKKQNAEYHLCVDESTSRRRFLANQLQNMGFEIEWCIKALIENKDDVMGAANWLGLHAPSARPREQK